MRAIFVIGLLKSLQKKFEAECRKNGLHVRAVLAEIGREGTFTLLPVGQDAKHALHAYTDKLRAFEDGLIVVLPYADIPHSLMDELAALSEMGCKVIQATNGAAGWPKLQKRQRPDTAILNSIYERLWRDLPRTAPAEQPSVSRHYRKIQEGSSRICIFEGVFETCDAVASHRLNFMTVALDALVEFLHDEPDQRIDAFFREKGIEHAQTGGISTTLTVIANGSQIHHETMSTHLKKGDNTSPEGAVRIYYQLFMHNDIRHAAVLYAGAHPSRDVHWTYHIGRPIVG